MFVGKLPEGYVHIHDIEDYFVSVVKDNSFARDVIKDIEQGDYVDSTMFKDRFGALMRYDNLSTSSKILISLNQSKDNALFFGDELGLNALEMLSELKRGNVYFTRLNYSFPFNKSGVEIQFNGKKFDNLDDLNEALDYYEFENYKSEYA